MVYKSCSLKLKYVWVTLRILSLLAMIVKHPYSHIFTMFEKTEICTELKLVSKIPCAIKIFLETLSKACLPKRLLKGVTQYFWL